MTGAFLLLVAALGAAESRLLQEYDFIVVGGGSAGAAVASRLSEVANWSVLLLEAGGEETIINQIPGLVAYTIPTAWSWGYRTEKTPGACLGLRDQRCPWPRGRVLGGTSVINYMIYTRGVKYDYDAWEAAGNPGWGFDEALRYFTKSEDQQNALYRLSPYHGTGGPLTVGEAPYQTPLSRAFLDTAEHLGFPLRDLAGETASGFQRVQGTIRRGMRVSSAKAFLPRSVRSRQNLHVLLHARVLRVLVKGGKAVGVEVARSGERRTVVQARKEVVLSAGTLNSAQLLMLSGIGPVDHLKDLGIPVVANLSVGENLQDHVGLGGLTFLVNASVGLTEANLRALPVILSWLSSGTGPLTVFGGAEAVGLTDSRRNEAKNVGLDWPDVELLFAGGSTNSDDGGLMMAHDLSDEVYDKVFRPIRGKHSWTVFPIGLRPHSRGHIRLQSSDPNTPPLFHPNYLSDRRDVVAILDGLKLALEFHKNPAFQRYGSTLHAVPIPGCEHLVFGSDEYWECHLRHYTMLFHHQVGTCKMGPRSDPESVVDARLRVHGIRGLRVADASIMPTIPSCHTNAAAIMVAEKAADLIKEDWGQL